MQQEYYMKRCLQLAEMGLGKVAPNPMVGAVLVYEGRIIGEGYHMKYGQAHAEVNCIKSVSQDDSELISQSALYVSLEPCNHHGQTPPCTDLILQYKIPRVVIGCKDPFSKVNGAGIQRLKDAGVEVNYGVLENEAVNLNKRFFTFHNIQRPYIILKWTQTGDGFIGLEGGRPLKISNALTNRLVHKWRSEEAAIMVGTNTALSDNPSLTTRLWAGSNPVRIVIDWDLQLSSASNLLDGSATTIVINKIKEEKTNNIHYFKIENKLELIASLNLLLYQKNLTSLIVEGGTRLLQSFIDADCWDEARVITNYSLKINRGVASPMISGEQFQSKEKIENDEIKIFKRCF